MKMIQRQTKKQYSSLYRTAEEARLGFSGPRLIDGVRASRPVAIARESFWVWASRRIARQRVHFDMQALFVSLGRRGIVTALFLGMLSMGTMIHFLGQGVLAEDASPAMIIAGRVAGASAEQKISDDAERVAFEKKLHTMLSGYPIEDMIPYIAKQDRRVAGYLVAIAKKESNWGKRIPVYYGENCFNYWGYRGQDEIMGSAGHTCFDTPKEAITTVSARLNALVLEQGRATGRDLLIWKCGSSCAGHDAYDVSKWVSDVDEYYRRAVGK